MYFMATQYRAGVRLKQRETTALNISHFGLTSRILMLNDAELTCSSTSGTNAPVTMWLTLH